LDAEPTDDADLVRCAIYTRQSVARPGDDPALASCAVQRVWPINRRRALAEVFVSMTWRRKPERLDVELADGPRQPESRRSVYDAVRTVRTSSRIGG
jgi:hypothetical protein